MRAFALWPIAVVFGTACGGAPPPPLTAAASNVVIRSVDEDQDEWLHEHCTYRGPALAHDDSNAIATAEARKANFVEPLFRETSSSTIATNGAATTTTSAAHHVILFDCKEKPAW
jgi:hypothetical protein